MLLLNGLPPRTQIAIDAQHEAYLTNEQFSGIKSLPAGWHCISWSITSTHEDSQAGPSEGSVRNVWLRWFDQGETAVRELDRVQQRLVLHDSSSSNAASGSRIGRSQRRYITRTFDPSGSRSEPTLVTPEVLSSVEPRLLPYPASADRPWRGATQHLSSHGGHIGRQVVAKVLGTDSSSGDSTTDSLASGPSRSKDVKEEAILQLSCNLGRNENGKVIWGKSRPEAELYEVAVDGEDANESLGSAKRSRKRSLSPESPNEEDESIHFTPFDPRRSWPPDSVGGEITRWSQDKSWLLRDVARRSRNGINSPGGEWYEVLMCEFELAFIVFIAGNNVYAWEQWKDLVSLFCHSSSLIGAQSAFHLHPSTTPDPTVLQTPSDLSVHIAFLMTLHAQLLLLPKEFWTIQTSPAEEQGLLKQLDILRGNIARSLSGAPSQAGEEAREKLVAAWRTLSHSTTSVFGWDLDRRLDEEAEVEDDLEAEEGEDAPVVVDL